MRVPATVVVTLLIVLAALSGGCSSSSRRGPAARGAGPRPAGVPAGPPAAGGLLARVPSDRAQLATAVDRAQAIIDAPASGGSALAQAGQFEQLATVALAGEPAAERETTLQILDGPAAATMRTNLSAGAALGRLVAPRRSLPNWKIVAPPAPGVLLSYFRAAQARYGVAWPYLAAIEFVETRFGRVTGSSPAGAQGPMQFLPATWARYGQGDVDDPRAAILGAAHYLAASGAPGDIAAALYHYNPSRDYVDAILGYAGRMRADPRAYYGYYCWQVTYARSDGLVILPVGYPHRRPEPVWVIPSSPNG